ncbi:MAG: hypothetical protein A2Z18_10080 [Armatimonadetes bacterium RBG_16_58_9]|nr:MAG: hypothetical protein A2Z18_10080 [Armatimonadetes bacterium RBG_16_58_9]
MERATNMLDDYKYSVGRLVVYTHSEPKLPRQSYGHYGPGRTIGEVLDVDMAPKPSPHWLYTIQNVRNQEVTRIPEQQIEFATTGGKRGERIHRAAARRKTEDGALAEMIAKALSNPDRQNLLRFTLGELLRKEESATKASREGPDLPVREGDYIRVRGDLRPQTRELHNHYAKILAVEPADIAGIENAHAKPGQPTVYRTLRKYEVATSEGVKAGIYDAEVKLFYTARGRKTILNWRAATLLAEAFGDEPPYNLEYEYLATHVFTRDELAPKRRGDLAELLGTLLYVKGKLGWRDYQRRHQFLAVLPRNHLIDSILQTSRFDYRRNRPMTGEEIAKKHKEGYKLRRLLRK